MRDGLTDSNVALSSQRITVNDPGNVSLLSTQNVAGTVRGPPAEIPEEVYPTVSAMSEDFTVKSPRQH
jgi:hypothetical protein